MGGGGLNPVAVTCIPCLAGLTYHFIQQMKQQYGSLHYGNEGTDFETTIHKARHITYDAPKIAAGKAH
eukprot:CAMPEP_0174828878 /NCGR_PEP_ID=MMETSP1114-20130205/1584_1 /TAXON_ID=312471 /ORGANISM="Neobodo designis, Strain CCAP 1951/1" /LENGTH=67 /DNA_ID=CAMNT_0016062605 /DNA_START=41 /DNA_END=244 /DNA_ORIENTATION=+